MKQLALFLLFLPLWLSAQHELEWTKLGEIPIEKDAAVAVNYLNNIYFTKNQALNKIDSNFVLTFHQSVSKWGNISFLDARNPMKLLFFSKEQQLLGFLDNTLALQENTIDLSAENFSYVTQIASSSQPDRFWIFDNSNATITLLSSGRVQSQKIENLYGMLHLKEVNQLIEHRHQLYIVDSTQGIFILNQFGSWDDVIRIQGIENIAFANEIILYVKDTSLHFIQLKDRYQDTIPVPVDGLKKIIINGNRFYLITDEKVTVYFVKNKMM